MEWIGRSWNSPADAAWSVLIKMNAFWYAESDSEAQCAPAVVRDLVRDAVRRAAQLKVDLKFAGAAIVYSWPAQGHIADYLTGVADSRVED